MIENSTEDLYNLLIFISIYLYYHILHTEPRKLYIHIKTKFQKLHSLQILYIVTQIVDDQYAIFKQQTYNMSWKELH